MNPAVVYRITFSMLISLCTLTTLTAHSLNYHSQNSEEQNCQDVSFESRMGPVRDQGNIGWCYANSTADLLTYEFREELDRRHIRAVSAVYVALTFNNSIFRTFLGEGGLDFISVRQGLHQGFCPQEVEDWIHQQGSPYHIKEKMEYFDWLKRVYDYYGATKVYAELNRIQSSQSILTRLPPRELVRILRDSNKKNVAKNLADYFCQGRRFIPTHYPDVVWRSKYLGYTRRHMVREIHEQLNNSNVVGIAYFADFFSTENLAVGANAPKTEEGRHMSTIVGRRWNKNLNRCELKIRNSWGARCSGYKNPEYQKPENCLAGYVWVDQETIRENIYGLTYFDHRLPDQSNAALFTPVH